jgi:hypothetical protein
MNRASDSAGNATLFSIASSAATDPISSCANMTGTILSCEGYVINILDVVNITQYELRQRITFDTVGFGALASDPGGAFVVSVNSDSKPGYAWMKSTNSTSTSLFSGWKQLIYPQDDWSPQPATCVAGAACTAFTVAPSMRYQHTSVKYKSWNFQRDILPHPSLCKAQGFDNSNCTSACLVDTECAVNSTVSTTGWSLSDFYGLNVYSAFWSSLDSADDGLGFPVYGTSSSQCPNRCCGDRRLCMRTRDNLGRPVPFDRTYLLMFGGRTRQKQIVNSTLDLYLDCELILTTMTFSNTVDQAYASCLEQQSDELWRYDTVDDIWELIKPNTAQVAATAAQTVPFGRFGHSATLVQIPAEKDLIQTRRQYMFIFGGISLRCTNGLCNDLWRYEIPWAAQAYWNPAMATNMNTFNRGNVWTQMTASPYGGRYRHSMVATETGDTIYIFGGETDSTWENSMLIYRVAGDSWDRVAPLGYQYFTRSAVDYLGDLRLQNLTDFSDFTPATDTLAPAIAQPNATVAATTRYFPQFPAVRGDHSMLLYSESVNVTNTVVNTTDNSTTQVVSAELVPVIWLIGGYRTYDPPYPSTTPNPDFQYYLENVIWCFGNNGTTWEQLFTSPDKSLPTPPARRGASAVIIPRPSASNDSILLYFGGNRADDLFSGLWALDFQRSDRNERIWRQLGQNFLNTPPPVTYHTMNLDKVDNTTSVYLFGGLRWTQSDLDQSDVLTDSDRRCFMSARNIMKVECAGSGVPDPGACALDLARSDIASKCNTVTNSTGFCCGVDLTAAASLVDLSSICTTQCQTDSFQWQMSLAFGEGMWIYNPDVCLNDCSGGNGVCEFSQCVCRPGWSGADCSTKVCPGSFCYYDPVTKTQHCNECSGNGACETGGTCVCTEGWAGEDCSRVKCDDSCGTHGQCLSDFPTEQCICLPGYSGMNCSDILCLNHCSSGGTCRSDGSCDCRDKFFGDDCSVYLPTLAGGLSRGYPGVLLLVLVVTVYEM